MEPSVESYFVVKMPEVIRFLEQVMSSLARVCHTAWQRPSPIPRARPRTPPASCPTTSPSSASRTCHDSGTGGQPSSLGNFPLFVHPGCPDDVVIADAFVKDLTEGIDWDSACEAVVSLRGRVEPPQWGRRGARHPRRLAQARPHPLGRHSTATARAPPAPG
ncbi:hypothetical protein VTK56DRAFT_9073 [Thermocarpiscus australiensis]